MAWRWIDKNLLLLLHDESLAEHGGDSGMRDEGFLDSALARPINLVAYEVLDFAALAASYCIGIAKNHPFVDGNKRAALLATGLFLLLNGQKLVAAQTDATHAILGVAAGEISETEFAEWIRRNSSAK